MLSALIASSAAIGAPAAYGATDLADTYPIEKIVGPGSDNLTELRWNVWGADLGSMFEHEGRTYMVFGDTYGAPQKSDLAPPPIPPPDPNTQENAGLTTRLDHRSNTMAYFDDLVPAAGPSFDGMISDRPGHAAELLGSLKIKGEEQTVIPNSGISVGGRMYLHYFSIRTFGPAPQWTMNYSGLAYSDDDGHTWTKSQDARWAGCCDPATNGRSSFGIGAFTRVGPHVYLFGVPGGRWGGVKLARVPAHALLSPNAYRYWDGDSFDARTEEGGVEIIPPMVGEMSVAWSPYYRLWLMMHTDGNDGNVVIRTAECLAGPWSAEALVIPIEAGVPYAPMLPPQGSFGRDIYFGVTLGATYGTWWWHTSLLGEPRGGAAERCVSAVGPPIDP